MNRVELHSGFRYALIGLLVLTAVGCDNGVVGVDTIVVEAYFETGESLAPVRLSRASSLAAIEDGAVEAADVRVSADGSWIAYFPDPEQPGLFLPTLQVITSPGMQIAFEATTPSGRVEAGTIMPPTISIDSVRVTPSPMPVRAVVRLGDNSIESWVYTLTVTMHWSSPEEEADGWWIRPRITPPIDAPQEAGNAFVRLGTLAPEGDYAIIDQPGTRSWEGSYAILVNGSTAVLPEHEIHLALLRSGLDYARFRQSTAGGQGNPVGNVQGGLGIVAGISIDRTSIIVMPKALPTQSDCKFSVCHGVQVKKLLH